MKFWDASALVPAFATERKTPDVEAILQADAEVLVWWTCRTEIKGALYRKVRERVLSPTSASAAAAKVDALLGNQAIEIPPEDAIRDEADAILARHPLRAADSLHLAAWRLFGRHLPFVCLDDKLRAAALAEGATVLP